MYINKKIIWNLVSDISKNPYEKMFILMFYTFKKIKKGKNIYNITDT